jgi:hypothetical protein
MAIFKAAVIKSSVSEENHLSVPRLVFPLKITGLISVPLLIMPPLTWILKLPV